VLAPLLRHLLPKHQPLKPLLLTHLPQKRLQPEPSLRSAFNLFTDI
jgi:hypothetical protein